MELFFHPILYFAFVALSVGQKTYDLSERRCQNGILRTFYNWKVYDGYKLSPEINGLVQLEERKGSSLEYCLSVCLGIPKGYDIHRFLNKMWVLTMCTVGNLKDDCDVISVIKADDRVTCFGYKTTDVTNFSLLTNSSSAVMVKKHENEGKTWKTYQNQMLLGQGSNPILISSITVSKAESCTMACLGNQECDIVYALKEENDILCVAYNYPRVVAMATNTSTDVFVLQKGAEPHAVFTLQAEGKSSGCEHAGGRMRPPGTTAWECVNWAWNEYNSSNTINYIEMYVPNNLAPNSGCYAKICSNGNLDLGTAFNSQGNWRVFSTLDPN